MRFVPRLPSAVVPQSCKNGWACTNLEAGHAGFRLDHSLGRACSRPLHSAPSSSAVAYGAKTRGMHGTQTKCPVNVDQGLPNQASRGRRGIVSRSPVSCTCPAMLWCARGKPSIGLSCKIDYLSMRHLVIYWALDRMGQGVGEKSPQRAETCI